MLTFKNPATTWITSDTHYGHDNIRKYMNRPFLTCKEMDDALIRNINDLVAPQDTLIHLGDVAWGNDKLKEFFKRITCQNLYLLRGNHDKEGIYQIRQMGFPNVKEVRDVLEFNVTFADQTQFVVCSHYAFKVWNRSHYGSWNFFGHSHGNLPDDPNSLSVDVGVDCHGFNPINMLQVKEIMSKKTWVSPFVEWTRQGKVWKKENEVKGV